MSLNHIQTYNHKEMSEFVAEVVKENPEWVKERRLEFLYSKLWKQMKGYLNFASRCLFYGFNFDDIPEPKKTFETAKEISMWKKSSYEKPDISEIDIDDAKKADCSKYLKIERKDYKRSWAICPFHQETKPSLCCYDDGKGWHCFGCGAGGDAISLVMKLYGLKFKEAVKFIIYGTY